VVVSFRDIEEVERDDSRVVIRVELLPRRCSAFQSGEFCACAKVFQMKTRICAKEV